MPTIVSSREFRTNQGKYLDMVESGNEKIIIKRKESYILLTPIVSDEITINPQVPEKVRKAEEEIKNGNVMRIDAKSWKTIV